MTSQPASPTSFNGAQNDNDTSILIDPPTTFPETSITPPNEPEPEPEIDGEPPKKRPRKERDGLGESMLPFARVQKIIKADKDIPIISKEATFLISLVTEEFIKRLAKVAQRKAKGVTVQYRDIASAVREDEFRFLEELFTWMPHWIEEEKKRKDKKKDKDDKDEEKQPGAAASESSVKVVSNEDGTLTYGGGSEDEDMS